MLEFVAATLRRHAPDVPVVEVSRTDTGAMNEVMDRATETARPGDTALLEDPVLLEDAVLLRGSRPLDPGSPLWRVSGDCAARGNLSTDAARLRLAAQDVLGAES